MAPSARADSTGGLLRRVVSALVLAPPVAASVYFGSPYFELVLALAAVQMAREWARLCCGSAPGRIGMTVVMGLAGVASLVVARSFGIVAGIAGALVAAILVYGAGRRSQAALPGWLAAGTLALAIPCVSFLWIRFDALAGRDLTLWLLAAVWATDIGAYAAGRTIGGPKLWPQVSPRKTWAGLLGGMASAALVSVLAAWWLEQGNIWLAQAAGILLAGVAQLGDLAESALKRHFGVKDSGRLIPGHGGLLDRVDGLIATAPAVAVLTWLFGASLIAWR
ncbi:MAG: phosphatidate cytidylyltransferase [Proteobacteria bacterium]|nr:phosphatidate cytidylyltransferase [Pseudomonadota bacterium]MBI3496883.1 phosphatidate cytidylyltransferase [Pseudomonadota bacterium]